MKRIINGPIQRHHKVACVLRRVTLRGGVVEWQGGDLTEKWLSRSKLPRGAIVCHKPLKDGTFPVPPLHVYEDMTVGNFGAITSQQASAILQRNAS